MRWRTCKMHFKGTRPKTIERRRPIANTIFSIIRNIYFSFHFGYCEWMSVCVCVLGVNNSARGIMLLYAGGMDGWSGDMLGFYILRRTPPRKVNGSLLGNQQLSGAHQMRSRQEMPRSIKRNLSHAFRVTFGCVLYSVYILESRRMTRWVSCAIRSLCFQTQVVRLARIDCPLFRHLCMQFRIRWKSIYMPFCGNCTQMLVFAETWVRGLNCWRLYNGAQWDDRRICE